MGPPCLVPRRRSTGLENRVYRKKALFPPYSHFEPRPLRCKLRPLSWEQGMISNVHCSIKCKTSTNHGVHSLTTAVGMAI